MHNYGSMRHELETLIESSKASAKQDLLQLAERVESVSASASSERINQNFDMQIQGVRDMILADRSARRTELVAMNSIIAEGRQNILQEGRSREALESRRVADMAWLSERIEAMEKARAESPQTTATSRLQQLEHRSMDMDRKLADISR